MSDWTGRYAVEADRPPSPASADSAVMVITSVGERGIAEFRFRDRAAAEAFASSNTRYGRPCVVQRRR